MNIIQRIMRSLREHGVYAVGAHRIESLRGSVRNFLIARKLGVEKLRVGSKPQIIGRSYIQMGEDFSASDSLWLFAYSQYNDQCFSPKIVIGNHVRISRQVQIAATNLIEIGDNVLMGSGVLITDHNHGQYSNEHTSPHIPPASRPLDQSRSVRIEKNVWLGAGVVVTPDSFIGEGAVIGANSVVRGRIPAFTVAAGVPAKVIKKYDFDTGKWINIK